MKKFEGMLFCTDLDGTLYTDDKRVSRENLDAIAYFQSEGGLFTFITGRPPATAGHICELIHPNAPYGCFNGGGIFDPAKGEYLWNMELDGDVIELVREVDFYLPDMGIQYNTAKGVYFNKDNAAMEHFRAVTGLPNLACHYSEVQEPAVKIVFAHLQEAKISALMELLHSHPFSKRYDFIRSEKILYEILPKGVSKGAVLRKMAELLGIEMNNTVAVGDYNNDVSMIRAAGRGFAVANAVPEAKDAADFITVSNNDHAIAAIVDGLDKNKFQIR
ncbi:MAG: HAD family phosphatase [Clostridia bacterium]|nr:HAD family phosphatase [Clostridia bacterium]